MAPAWKLGLFASGLLLVGATARAEDKPPLDATASDPVTLGWMQGSPPPPDKRIVFERGDHMRFPMTRWSFSHMRELVPTVRVSRGKGQATTLPAALRGDIDAITFTPLGSDRPMRWDESLKANYTDAILVLHKGRIVYERYFGVTTPETRHIAFSVTKSFVGTIAEMLIASGKLDEAAPVVRYVPELAGSGFADASVRQVMDMTTGLAYSEDYADPNSGVGLMRIASGLEPRPAGYAGPENLFAFVSSVAKSGSNGVRFTYGSINTQALALVVERIERKPLAQVLSERIWQPLGMEGDADWSVDSVGTELAAGGLQPILRDMARFGEAMRLGGRFNGKQVIPASAVQSIRRGGRREDFAKAGYKLLPGWSYRSQWWVTHNAHGAFAARGIYGQAIYVDPAAEMVIARFASHPTSFNAALDPTTLPAFQAVAEHLMRRR